MEIFELFDIRIEKIKYWLFRIILLFEWKNFNKNFWIIWSSSWDKFSIFHQFYARIKKIFNGFFIIIFILELRKCLLQISKLFGARICGFELIKCLMKNSDSVWHSKQFYTRSEKISDGVFQIFLIQLRKWLIEFSEKF